MDVHDIEAVEAQVKRFDQTLKESEEDFIELRNEIFRRHQLIAPKNIIDPGRNPNEISVYTRPQPEVEQIVKGINLKFLRGDRWLIRSTRQRLKNTLEQLNHLPVSGE